MSHNTIETSFENRSKAGRNAGIVGIGVNLLLFAVKLFAGIVSGSVSIIADAINNLTDAGSSILVIVGYVVAAKPADKEHPYGHARMEYICSLFISIIVTVLGLELMKSSVDSLISSEKIAEYSLLSIIIMSAAIVGKIFLAIYYRIVGKKIDSDTLKASAVDSVGDVCATSAVILGIILTPVIGPKADGIFGLLIAVYIFVMGIKLIREACNTILGTPPDTELVKKIITKLRSYDGVLGIHDLVIHSYGVDQFFATAHVEVDAERDVMESHDLIDNMEVDFKRDLGIQMVIHLDPVALNDKRTNELHNMIRTIIDEIAAEYSCPMSMHDFRAVFGVTHTNIIFDIAVANDTTLKNDEIVEMIREYISQKCGEEYNAIITIDRDYTTTRY